MRKLALRALLASLSIGIASAVCVPIADAAPALPTADPFYSYSGPLTDITPGTVLRSRPMSTALPGIATQMLYRTTDQRHRPSVTAAVVIRPPAATGAPRIVSYQEAYDALGARCDPSYTVASGGASVDQGVLAAALSAGYTVVTADYEGEGLDYGAGQEAGYGTLDGIRAADHVLGADPAATPTAMVGFSGGGIATEFAAELARTYAPELHIIGAVEGGLPVNFMRVIDYIDGSPQWSKVLPLVLTGVSHGFGMDFTPYLSPYGIRIMNQARGMCALDTQRLPVITVKKLLKPEYPDYHKLSPLIDISDTLTMGKTGTPRFPMLMAAGNSDGTGDGVMIAADQRALARTLCERGVPVDFHEFAGADHVTAGALGLTAAMPYLAQRFAGQPPPNTCATQ
ncbi:lipase family protein [Nocardia alni]|uniref:lipase family protein n=1 Tax=Nocardia alni TaxID=2815723 RepID=UPI001C245011|nr:lipase family protein [Nocardia alni]